MFWRVWRDLDRMLISAWYNLVGHSLVTLIRFTQFCLTDFFKIKNELKNITNYLIGKKIAKCGSLHKQNIFLAKAMFFFLSWNQTLCDKNSKTMSYYWHMYLLYNTYTSTQFFTTGSQPISFFFLWCFKIILQVKYVLDTCTYNFKS